MLILDNCSSRNVKFSELKFTDVEFLPPNCTAKYQPLENDTIQGYEDEFRYECGDNETVTNSTSTLADFQTIKSKVDIFVIVGAKLLIIFEVIFFVFICKK